MRKSFCKSLLNLEYKKQENFSLPDHQLAEILIFVFDFCERTKKGENKFVIKFVGIIAAIIAM